MDRQSPQIIPVYIRKGSTPDQRTISFRIDDGFDRLDDLQLLTHGFAIDGNQAICVVQVDELLAAQRLLVVLFQERGVRPDFV